MHVELEPEFEISRESMRRMWRDVLAVCEPYNIRRVLVEGERPQRTMGKLDVFEHGRLVAGLHLRGLRVAFCLYEFEPDQLTHMFTLIANDGFNSARHFRRIEDAMGWLRH